MIKLNECPECGGILEEHEESCPDCCQISESDKGTERGVSACPYCDFWVKDDDELCPRCGSQLERDPSVGLLRKSRKALNWLGSVGGNEQSSLEEDQGEIYDDIESFVTQKATGLSKKVKLENILQRWSANMPGMANQFDDFFKKVINEFEKKQTGLQAEWVNVGSLFGSKRTMLSIGWDRYKCYIGAIVFGIDLLCTWDLYDPKNTIFGASVDNRADNRAAGFFKSDFNEVNELEAFATVCLDCARIAAEKIFDENNLDKARLKKPSSGVLGPL